jgi:predicted RNA binding protein YcfA (HicA-like mRNA interferase family)
MPHLPRVSGREAVSVFERAGFEVRRQRGSHVIMTKPGRVETLSIPDHRELQAGTLRALIRKAGLSVEQFEAFLRR